MKTKIIYISGSEIFNIADIRAAFETVRNALQLDSNTVLFGVPVDKEDASLSLNPETNLENSVDVENNTEELVEDTNTEPIITDEPTEVIETIETVVEEKPVKSKQKRGRKTVEPEQSEQQINENSEPENSSDKVVPILSVLSTKGEDDTPETDTVSEEIVEEEIISDEPSEDIKQDISQAAEIENDVNDVEEPDLEKLLSEMTPLQEDIPETNTDTLTAKPSDSDDDSESIDATLEQLATEFAETQDKIASETKSSGRGKISKLRNILPFKQSKHKDQGLGDLFGWAGVAANDEDFSVPGFFTNATSKK